MLVVAVGLAGDKRLQQVRVDLAESEAALQRAVPRARAAQHQAVAILEREARHARRRRERPRQREGNPKASPQPRGGDRATGNRQSPSGSTHGFRSVTVKTPPSLRPCTAGLYISSACAGGRTNVPGVVARATYVAV